MCPVPGSKINPEVKLPKLIEYTCCCCMLQLVFWNLERPNSLCKDEIADFDFLQGKLIIKIENTPRDPKWPK